MPFTRVKSTTSCATYDITSEDVALVNSIRRIILADIPNVAFVPDTMTIKTNTGNLHNEMLAHRVSLVPICVPAEKFEEMTRTTFVLHKKNTTQEIVHLTTADFTIESQEMISATGELPNIASIFPPDPLTGEHILITKLMPGQEVHILAKPQLGTAKQHARWGAVSKCSYMNALDLERINQERAEWLSSGKDESIFESHQKYRYYRRNCFEFYIESECALRPDWLLHSALNILATKCERIFSSDSNKAIVCDTDTHGIISIKIPGEDYTLVNYLQSTLYNKHIGGALTYVGYYKPHPLEDVMYLKLKFDSAHAPESVIKWLEGETAAMATQLRAIQIE